jgi:ClpP class serine protease
MIDTGTLENIRIALQKFKGKPFDLILHTPGGSIFAAQLISKLIQKYPSAVRAIVPVYAMSGGSFLALSCDEILLANTAALGAIDPQIGYLWHYGSAKSWDEVIKKKHGKADDGSIQMAYTGRQYANTLHKWVSELLLEKIPFADKRESAATFLTDGNIEHGRPLMICDLNEIGIPVIELEDKMITLINPILNSTLYEGEYWI